jgi:serine/threonine protein kinase
MSDKYQVSDAEHFGIWAAYGPRCFWCRGPLSLSDCTVDHVIAESTAPDELNRLRALYSLGDAFELNDFCNWVPAHPNCNARKATGLEREASPAMIMHFLEINRRAPTARSIAAEVANDRNRGRLLGRLRAAIESGLITREDVDAHLDRASATNQPTQLLERRWRIVRDAAGFRYLEDDFAPTYSSNEGHALAERLARARQRLERLRTTGEDTREAKKEVLELKRALRDGGRLRAGDELGDRFLLLSELGHGGFGTVWKALDKSVITQVAVKVLHPHLAGDRIRRERFERGARTMQELSHPAIVPLVSSVDNDGGYYFFAMRFAERGDLRRALVSGDITTEIAVDAVLQAAEGLAHAHACGRVHRDIKPENILLGAAGEVFLTDFDLVMAADTTGGTRTGMMGTPIYSPLELLTRPQDANAATDVYGVGMSMLFALSGGDLPDDVLFGGAESVLDSLDCKQAVKDVLKRAVSRDRSKRFENAGEFVSAIRAAFSAKASRRKATKKRKRKSAPTERRRYGVPVVTKGRLLAAMRRFDDELRSTPQWVRWATSDSGRHQYAIESNGQRYPVKQILFMASGTPKRAFSGGRDANKSIQKLGFKIVQLHEAEDSPVEEALPELTRDDESVEE